MSSAFAHSALDLLLLSVASGTLALTLTYSHVTKPLRHRFIGVPMLGELINCPFCASFWTGLFFFPFDMSRGIIYNAIMWLIVVGLSSLFIGILLKLFLFREAENEELRKMVRLAEKTIKILVAEREKS